MSATIAAAAAKASRAAPPADVRIEPNAAEGFPGAIRLTIWREGRQSHLADVHPYGARVRWLAD
ncbi:MAG TPA: hypothetical protein VEA44_10015 [Caulobacter sp.]|nr:hypothetical protein [Caulobacter sp.]